MRLPVPVLTRFLRPRTDPRYGAALLLYAGTGNGSKNLKIRNNTLLACGCNQTSGDHGVIAFLHAGQTGAVDGNVLADCGSGSVVYCIPSDTRPASAAPTRTHLPLPPTSPRYYGDVSGFSFADNAILPAASLPSLVAPTPVVPLPISGATRT